MIKIITKQRLGIAVDVQHFLLYLRTKNRKGHFTLNKCYFIVMSEWIINSGQYFEFSFSDSEPSQ